MANNQKIPQFTRRQGNPAINHNMIVENMLCHSELHCVDFQPLSLLDKVCLNLVEARTKREIWILAVVFIVCVLVR